MKNNNAQAHAYADAYIQSADLWRESGRYDAFGAEMLRIKDRHDRDMLFTPTAEETNH